MTIVLKLSNRFPSVVTKDFPKSIVYLPTRMRGSRLLCSARSSRELSRQRHSVDLFHDLPGGATQSH